MSRAAWRRALLPLAAGAARRANVTARLTQAWAARRLSLAWRFFLAQLLAILVVGAVGVELVRWRFFDNFGPRAIAGDVRRLGALEAVVTALYRQHHDWSFLPAAEQGRRAWLRDAVARLDPAADQAPSLEHRIGLFDAQRQLLAGVSSRRWLVALASIDRTERPLIVDGERIGFLVLAAPQNPADGLAVAFLLDQQQNLLLVFGVSVGLSALAAALLAAQLRRPLRQLVSGARQLESAHYESRVTLGRRDELGELASAFNHLAAKLESAERARRQWVADTSHELRTPLAVLRAQLEALQDGVRSASPENVALLLKHVDGLGSVVDQLAEFARADVGQLRLDKAPLDAWQLVREVFESFGPRFAAAGLVATLTTAPTRSTISGDANRLRQVLINVLENSARYTRRDGRVEVRATSGGGALEITVDDTAPPVPVEALARLGERFFRLASISPPGGMGVGLALAKLLVEKHGGSVRFGDSPLGGLRVTVVLPLGE
jgi:two-component system, OmpR family, sensor histidine kinase BaeS